MEGKALNKHWAHSRETAMVTRLDPKGQKEHRKGNGVWKDVLPCAASPSKGWDLTHRSEPRAQDEAGCSKPET